MSATSRLDRVEVAEDVRDRHIRRRQLLDVAVLPRDPFDRCLFPVLFDQLPAVLGNRVERVVVDLTARQDRHAFVQEIEQRSQDTALGLPAQSQQDEVVLREDGVHHLRNDRVLVAHDAGKEFLSRFQHAHQVLAHLVLDGARVFPGRRPLGLSEFTERTWEIHVFPSAWPGEVIHTF